MGQTLLDDLWPQTQRLPHEYAERLKNLRDESLTAVADHSTTPRGTLRVGANEARMANSTHDSRVMAPAAAA